MSTIDQLTQGNLLALDKLRKIGCRVAVRQVGGGYVGEIWPPTGERVSDVGTTPDEAFQRVYDAYMKRFRLP